MNPVNGLVFRHSSEDGVEIRVSNGQWSLPTGVIGSVSVSVGEFNKNYAVDGNTASTISASIANEDLSSLFSAMNKASTMLVTAGKAKPINVSLVGSAKVTNAFLTCFGIRNGISNPGSNPFQ